MKIWFIAIISEQCHCSRVLATCNLAPITFCCAKNLRRYLCVKAHLLSICLFCAQVFTFIWEKHETFKFILNWMALNSWASILLHTLVMMDKSPFDTLFSLKPSKGTKIFKLIVFSYCCSFKNFDRYPTNVLYTSLIQWVSQPHNYKKPWIFLMSNSYHSDLTP